MDAAHVAVFQKRRLELIEIAKRVTHQEAVHYDGFHTDCAMLDWSPTLGYRIYLAGKHYPIKSGKRECAEHRAMKRAQDSDMEIIITFVTHGPVRADDFSNIWGKTCILTGSAAIRSSIICKMVAR
ncbi:MAG: hypothetical protein COT91_00670 [Candidatus Doudnabacteria bacterium CG10_big_fil_rev_8_21_14_0_10_41_10]|uniref:Uncharacterized protein n=1 Tax=Candidatus Doudnabacteria bacterium CG10_big_fil_rev_8_21_14_0_10_41_10 TaxID=1974551 RepID=A0A2H0VEQ5_9BACT|nr:MAG: hypothetical protein COT91_00670 [Candidatus Doudnabacteria bacterium CG10_big_fil_rev_8_21_14_0_10_41_10]